MFEPQFNEIEVDYEVYGLLEETADCDTSREDIVEIDGKKYVRLGLMSRMVDPDCIPERMYYHDGTVLSRA
jgi:hypothetical protein